MKKNFKKMLAATLSLVIVTSLAGCDLKSNGTAKSDSSDKTSSITVNIESEPPALSSLDCCDVVSMNVLRHTMVGLTKLNNKNEVIPGVAEKWDVSDDGCTYTFHLRDTKWSNGTPVTAKDFEFAWKKILNPDGGYVCAYLLADIKGASEYNSGKGSVDDVAVKAVNDKTLKVTLNQKTSYFTFLCAGQSMLPINEDFYNSLATTNGNSYGSEPDKLLYNGAYKITSWNHDSNMTLTKNADYFDASTVNIDTVNLAMVSNASTAYDMFKTNDLDMVNLTTGDQIAKAKKDGYDVQTKSNGATFILEFNTKNEIMKNANIRRALSYAINRKELVTNALKDASLPATTYTSTDITLGGKPYTDYVNSPIKDNDVTRAKEALAQGLKELGLKKLPKISITINDKDSTKTQAAVYQENWKKNLGVDLEVKSMPYKSQLSQVQSGDFQICITAFGPDYNDPSTFLESFRSNSGMNDTKYNSAEYDKLLDEAKVIMDPEKRAKAYAKAEELLLSDMPLTPVTYYNTSYVVSDKLTGLYRSSFQDISFMNASVK